jgi:CARDB protein
MSRLLVAALCIVCGTAVADGGPSMPSLKHASVRSDASFDESTRIYTYTYVASNDAANVATIGNLYLDDVAAAGYQPPDMASSLKLQPGPIEVLPFDTLFKQLETQGKEDGIGLVPVGTKLPDGWISDLRKSGRLHLGYSSVGPGKPVGQILAPGSSMQFSVASPGQPVIRTFWLRPDWIPEGDDDDPAGKDLYARLDVPLKTLGPGAEKPGSYEHWSRFRDDVQLAAKLGWINDPALAATVAIQLADARAAFDTQGSHQAEGPLKALLKTIDDSKASQRTAAAFALLKLNTEALLAQMEKSPSIAKAMGPVPHLELDAPNSSSVTARIDESVTFSGRLTDQANDDKPIVGYPISLYSGTGPHQHTFVRGKTDLDGRFNLVLAGVGEGTDMVIVGDKPASTMVNITWKGGPDLALEYFISPDVHWRGFGPLVMHARISNDGNGPALSSVVRFYVSASQPVDPRTATVVGEKRIGPLQPDESEDASSVPVHMPVGWPPGNYFAIACVDADKEVVETNETNNCGVGSSHMMIMHAVPAATTRN